MRRQLVRNLSRKTSIINRIRTLLKRRWYSLVLAEAAETAEEVSTDITNSKNEVISKYSIIQSETSEKSKR
ncbi:hypothetical protein AKA01nite_06030 [Alkalibacterium kapii]|uniref:Uncharacterized protein n=1 Tax=Alkalibacterium kapii TaxID=426704 RepID=A0A511AV52_9LACT|nr:hypothetical protein AKA01nite_06030 [Alkalibacterium kapii]